MSRHAAVDLKWADGVHTFRLGLGEIEELERKCDRGIFQIVSRLNPMVRECRLSEISEVLRIGLIGGGMPPVDALVKVERYVDRRPIEENRDVAYAIGLAALMRLHSSEVETPPGEQKAAKTKKSTSPRSAAKPS